MFRISAYIREKWRINYIYLLMVNDADILIAAFLLPLIWSLKING